MPDRIAVRDFIVETREDLSSPTTSNFLAAMNACRNTVGSLEENLDSDRTILHKLKKSIKAHQASGINHITNQGVLAENLEKLGSEALSREAETGIGTTFLKFSVMFKELCSLMKNLYTNYNNMVLFPLDSLLRGDLKEVRGDLRRPFDKAWKDYETKSSKIEKEKKKLAQEAGLIRTEVTGSEMVEETERERKVFQLQMCEYLVKVNEIKVKKEIELAQHLMEFYHAQVKYFQEGMQVLESIRGYAEESVHDLQQLRATHEEEKKELMELRKHIKAYLQPDKETVSSGKGGYSLHGQQGDQTLGTEKAGHLLKRSEGLRKVWQKRYCVIKNGQFSLAHSTTSSPSQTLNLLLCQVKEEEGKKRNFSLVSQNRTYLFQAEDEADLEAWVSVVSNSRKEALEKAFGDSGERGASDDSQSIVHNLKELRQSIVEQVQRLPGNDICCDCSFKDPTWLSTNLGVLTCIECSGIHRDMGTHVSRVRSLTLDNLGTAELLLAKALGNGGFNEIMESNLGDCIKPTGDSKMEERKEFIRAKYIHHKFAQKSGVTPEVLLQELHQSVKSRDILAVLQGFAEGVDLTAPVPGLAKGSGALHVAIEQEDLSSLHIVDFLAQNTDHLNVADSEGNTAVHIAALMSKTECMKVLLRAGATDSLSIENKACKTPLALALETGDNDTIELVKAVEAGKLSRCDNVKIDWGLSEADGIYEDPLELLEIKLDVVSDDEALNELRKKVRDNYQSKTWGSNSSGQGVHDVRKERIRRQSSEPNPSLTNPPTPPRHRRVLPTRPVSQMIMPPFRPGGATRTQGEATVSALVSGLNLFPKPDLPAIVDRSLKVGGSPVMRRKPPPPPAANVEMVPVNIRHSIVAEPSALVSTFGHSTSASTGPSVKSSDASPDSPPPIPPVRCSSVSKPLGRHDGPLPPPPVPKPQQEAKTATLPRVGPPAPPPPRRRGSDMKKPNVPPVPAQSHRRSKSEGKIIFGEDEVDMRKRLNTCIALPGMAGGAKEPNNRVRRPPPPPKPTPDEPLMKKDSVNSSQDSPRRKISGSPQESPRKDSVGTVKDSPPKKVSDSGSPVPKGSLSPEKLLPSPAPPPRMGSELTNKSVQNPEVPLSKIQNEAREQPGTPAEPPPEIYPRLYSSPNMSGHPRRVQALYDCQADNDDELTFKEGQIILVTGEGEDEDWWMGEIEGHPEQNGVFPISFVHVLTD